MGWQYKKGDVVSWKQRDRQLRPNLNISDYDKEMKQLTYLYLEHKINVKIFVDKRRKIKDKYFYLSKFITCTGVSTIVEKLDIGVDNNSYYVLDNNRLINSNQLKLI
mgnify:FL=1|tara:strand:+ start:1465 stop:1785 length:321 start_codon:yes stop_codon:yes gene_type:complete